MSDFLGNLTNAVLVAGLYSTMSFGLTLIYGVMKIINLAHAGIMMFGAYTTFAFFTAWGLDPLVSVAIVFPLFFAFGALLHVLFIRRLPVSDVPTLPSLLLLFGIWLILQNIAYLVWTGDDRAIRTAYTFSTFALGGINVSYIRLLVFVIGVVALVALQLFLTRTYTGKAIRAQTQNRQASMLVGINTDRIAMLAFGLGVAFAALAGSLMASLYSFTPDFGREFLLKAFAIIVMGGLESFYGVALGALVLALVETFSVSVMQASYQPAIAFTLLVVVLVVMPSGIAGMLEGRRTR